MKNNYLLAALISISLVPSFVQGQDVTWGPATDIATDVGNSSDVSLNGTLVEAFNGVPTNVLDTTPVVTVNTVDFAPTASLFTSNQSSDPTDLSIATNAGDPEYDAILSVPNFGGGTNPATVTLGGGELVTGNNYEIQIWFVDDRPNGTLDLRETPISDTNGNTVTLNDQFSMVHLQQPDQPSILPLSLLASAKPILLPIKSVTSQLNPTTYSWATSTWTVW